MNPAEPGVPSAPEPIDSSSSAPIEPGKAFTVSDLFIGRDGLRAIWGLVLFLLLCELLQHCVYPLMQVLLAPNRNQGGLISPRNLFGSEGSALICVAVATWFMARIERRPASAYGFGPRRSLRNFLAGVASGAALLSLLVVILRRTGLLVFDARLIFGSSAFRYGITWLAGFLLVALVEEVLLRGYLQFTVTRCLSGIYRRLFGGSNADVLGFWTAAVALSFVFGFGHSSNPGESPLGLLAAGLVGLVFCLSLWRTGSLWWAIGFHASWDWAQSFLYGVADSGLMVKGHLFATHPVGRSYLSGGLTGPEGSVFLLPILLAAIAIIQFTLPRTHISYTPQATSLP
jgi:membrane protease YdiL (CAAX protease family)